MRPAVKIRLDLDFVDIRPVGRFVTGPLLLQHWQTIAENRQRCGDLSGGRVDMTNGERRYLLLRSITDGRDFWYVVAGDQGVPKPLDPTGSNSILQDLLG